MRKATLFLVLIGIAGILYAGGTGESADGQAVELSFGVNGNTESVEYAVAVAFSERLSELSEGSMAVEVFPNGQLGDAGEMIGQISLDELDAYMEPLGGLGSLVPEMEALNMSYVVTDLDHIQRIMASEWGEGVQETLRNDFNIRVLDHTLFGTRQTSANRVLNSIEDYRGLRIRTPNARALLDWAEAVGGRPTAIAFSEVYLALSTNSVDAQENPLPTIDAMKFYEVQEAIAIDNHLVQDKSILFSEARWQSLNSVQRGWLLDAASVAREVSVQMITERSEELITYFEEQGLTITYPDTAPMRRAMIPYYETLEEELGAPGLITNLANM